MLRSSLPPETAENMQAAPVGSPEQLKLRLWLNPPRSVIEIVLSPPPPGALIVIVVGFAVIEKSSMLKV